jgi:hypothetical protein
MEAAGSSETLILSTRLHRLTISILSLKWGNIGILYRTLLLALISCRSVVHTGGCWISRSHSGECGEHYLLWLTPYSPVEFHRRFGRKYFICPACSPRLTDFLLGLCFNPVDGRSIFLRTVGRLYQTKRRHIPEDRTLKLASSKREREQWGNYFYLVNSKFVQTEAEIWIRNNTRAPPSRSPYS